MVKALRFRALFTLFGILLILGAIGVELLPNTKTGNGTLQIIEIIVGVVVIILSRVSRSLGLGLLISIISIFVTLAIIELALAILGFEAKNTSVAIERVQISPDWLCDDSIGCRWVQEEVQDNCLVDDSKEAPPWRFCHVNSQGFYDESEFVSSASLSQADYRILVLGDSFTWGTSADMGKSWVELLESRLNQSQNVIVWNTGMSSTGTKQALANVRRFLPIMRPNLVLLGFYVGNDFVNNLFPLDYGVKVSIDGVNTLKLVQAYDLDQNLEPVKLSTQEIAYRALGGYWPKTELERFLSSTRVGSLLLREPDLFAIARSEKGLAETERLLKTLSDYVAANNAELIVLIIPHKTDLESPGFEYHAALDIVQRLEIPYIDPIDMLVLEDYNNPDPANLHWNNDGHRKAGELVFDCVSFLLAHDDIPCPQVETFGPLE